MLGIEKIMEYFIIFCIILLLLMRSSDKNRDKEIKEIAKIKWTKKDAENYYKNTFW